MIQFCIAAGFFVLIAFGIFSGLSDRKRRAQMSEADLADEDRERANW